MCLFPLVWLALALAAPCAARAELTAKLVDQKPPAELTEAIRSTLREKALQILDGDQPIYEFWFRSAPPLKAAPESPAKALAAFEETTLIGAARARGGTRDYKDNEVAKGVYTARFVFQPQDGDHLGTALFPYFLVLIPAAADTAPDAFTKYRPMVKASSKDTPTGHPVILSLRPASSGDGDLPQVIEPEPEHKAVRFRIAAALPGQDQPVSIPFELVFEGHGHIQ